MVSRPLAAAFGQQVRQRLAQAHPEALALVPRLVELWLAEHVSAEDLVTQVQSVVRPDGARGAARDAPSAAALFGVCRVLRGLMVERAREPSSEPTPGSVRRAHLVVDAAVGFVADAFAHEEALLEHSAAQFALVIDAIPQLVWRTTVTGEATFANRRFLEHVGCRLEDVLGWGWLSFIHPEDRARVGEEWARCRAADQAVSVAFRVRDAAGAYRWFLSLGNPFRDATGATVAYYGTWTDFDSHTQVVRALEDAVSARDTFLSVASHELKTPLTAMRMRVQMRLRRLARGVDEPPAAPGAQAAAEEDLAQVERMTRLVDDMLDVARLERGQLRFVDEALDLGPLLDHALARHAHVLGTAGCPWEASCAAGLWGRWDPLRVEQALANLLSNCARYARGSRVRIAARRARGCAVIEVADEGPGIAPADRERIFGRFERAISASEQSGLGLGLHLVKHIVEHYRGEVAVDSELGRGSTFRMVLPLPPAAGEAVGAG